MAPIILASYAMILGDLQDVDYPEWTPSSAINHGNLRPATLSNPVDNSWLFRGAEETFGRLRLQHLTFPSQVKTVTCSQKTREVIEETHYGDLTPYKTRTLLPPSSPRHAIDGALNDHRVD